MAITTVSTGRMKLTAPTLLAERISSLAVMAFVGLNDLSVMEMMIAEI